MRRFFFACLSMALVAGAIYSFEPSAKGRIAKTPPGHPIATIGDVFRRY